MLLGGGNKWTDFVRKWADDNKMTYLCAISNPEVSAAYKVAKKDLKEKVKETSFADLKEKAIALASVGLAPKKPRGRPKKYATEEEAKKAKLEQTLASNKKIYKEKTKNVPKAKRGRKERPYRQVVLNAQDEMLADLVAMAHKARESPDSPIRVKRKRFQIKGKPVVYLIDENNNLYSEDEQEVVGLYDPPNREIITTNGKRIKIDNPFVAEAVD
jgi:hypothetical protein